MSLAESFLPHYTYDDYVRWEGRWELIDGIPYSLEEPANMAPTPMIKHQEVSNRITIELYNKLEDCPLCHKLTAVDWKVDETTTICPDNLVYCGRNPGDYYLDSTPQIIFEILSPSTKVKDRTVKYNIYQHAGVKYYIMVDTLGKSAEIYLLKNGRYILIAELQDRSFKFELDDECHIEFDFKKLFENL